MALVEVMDLVSPDFTKSARALVIGISVYGDPKIGRLPSAINNDAADLVAVLTERCGFEPESVRLLQNGQAGRGDILAGLEWLSEGENSTRLLYFSGHGARAANDESFLVAYDSSLDAIDATCISATELTGRLQALKADRVLVLLDSCHSGGAAALKGFGVDGSPINGVSEKSLDALAQGKGRVIIAASQEDQASVVLSGARNSVFTQVLLDGLRGRAGRSGDTFIRVLDLYTYVSEEVPKIAPQDPLLKVVLRNNFPVAVNGGESKGAVEGTEAERGDRWWGRMETALVQLYPMGPLQNSVWSRAGGDLSRLSHLESGVAAWHLAVRMVRQGGGAKVDELLNVAAGDFPGNQELEVLSGDRRVGRL